MQDFMVSGCDDYFHVDDCFAVCIDAGLIFVCRYPRNCPAKAIVTRGIVPPRPILAFAASQSSPTCAKQEEKSKSCASTASFNPSGRAHHARRTAKAVLLELGSPRPPGISKDCKGQRHWHTSQRMPLCMNTMWLRSLSPCPLCPSSPPCPFRRP